ncbi:MAG: methyltransferase domain-containing protein [bacterium]|nr:methyltransferase domain-containing protein [bacterium]
MLDQAIRFGAILSQHEFQSGGLLLEVGSGSRGITDFVAENVIGVDIAFAQKPAFGLKAIKASATALPFKDNRCDRVISSDMLEHLSGEQRPAAIREMLRVTGGTLLMACPCGEPARRIDHYIAELYHLLKINPPDWLQEHLQQKLPDAATIRDILTNNGVAFKEIPGESTLTHFLVSLLISTNWLNRFWSRLFLRQPERACNLSRLPLLRLGQDYRTLWVVRFTPEHSSIP